MTFSLSSLSDFTATPGPPKTSIAPKELITIAKFPELLGGFQSGAAGVQTPLLVGDAKGEGLAQELQQEAGEAQGAGLNAFAALGSAAYGNAFPQPGTDLPPDLKGDGPSSPTEQAQNLSKGPTAGPMAGPATTPDVAPIAFPFVSANSPTTPIAPNEAFGRAQADLGQVKSQATQQSPEAATNAVSEIRAALLNTARQIAPSDVPAQKPPSQSITQPGTGGPFVSAISGGKNAAEPALPIRGDELRPTITTARGPDLSGSAASFGAPDVLNSPFLRSSAPQDAVQVKAKGEAINSSSPATLKSLGQIAPTATPARPEPATNDVAPALATSKVAKVELASAVSPSLAPPAASPAASGNDIARGEQFGAAEAETGKTDAHKAASAPAQAPVSAPIAPPQEPSAKVGATQPVPNLEPAQIAQTAAVASLAAKIAASTPTPALAPRLGSASDIRVQAQPGPNRAGAVSSDLTQAQIQTNLQNGIPLQTAVTFADGAGGVEAASDAQRGPPSASLAPALTPQPAAQSSGEVPAEAKTLQTAASPTTGAQTIAGLSPAPPVTQAPVTDTSAALRLGPQLENTIEQLADTRSNAQANRPELTVRHSEFGAITMRLENTGTDLRATLSARDPGFVPAIQTALAERSIAAAGETSNSNASKGNEQGGANNGSQSSGSQNNSGSGPFAGSQGHGWNSQGAYGSSTGSGQGTSQPYTGQTEGRDEELGSDSTGRTLGQGNGPRGEGELFA